MPEQAIIKSNPEDMSDAILRVVPSLCIVIAVLALLPPLLEMSQHLQAQSYTGVLDPRVLSANQNKQVLDLINYRPYNPWISASFINYGPNTAYVAVNDNKEESYLDIGRGEIISVNLSGASKRISKIYYKCDAGKTALVKVCGEW